MKTLIIAIAAFVLVALGASLWVVSEQYAPRPSWKRNDKEAQNKYFGVGLFLMIIGISLAVLA